jgi:4-methyl-5(b-hydroxyethyl)-thiazole monophosphate biosynthesis
MTTALFLLANGFEELEFIAPYDIFHRGGVTVKAATITSKKEVISARGVTVLADSLLQEFEDLSFDLLVLPGGGPGTQNLRESDSVKDLLLKSYNAGKQIAAICAAPKVLASVGILRNHCATSYPDVRADVEPHCKKYLDVPVVVSENIITSRGAGTAAEFSFCLLSLLAGFKVSAEVKSKMMF